MLLHNVPVSHENIIVWTMNRIDRERDKERDKERERERERERDRERDIERERN